jgi:hypothetical protein
MAELHFKFRERAPVRDRQAILDRLSKLGARKIAPLFPNEKDRELSAIYRVDCGPATTTRVLDDLNDDEAVEFVEPAVSRKLIR